jgi:hypothetical protein
MNIPSPTEYYNHCFKRRKPATDKEYMKILLWVINKKAPKAATKEALKINSNHQD